MLGIVAYLTACLHNVPNKIWQLIKDRVLVTVEIDNTDPSYAWVKAWLGTKGKSRYMVAGITVDTSSAPKVHDPSEKPKFSLCPRGLCIMRHRGRRVLAWLTKEQVQASRDFRETITLRAVGAPADFFRTLLDDAYEFASGRDGSTIQVWVPEGNYWIMQSRKQGRSRDTLVLAEGVAESVIDDARRFVGESMWYRERGIPHRRGYLLYGPPGTGKSSLAHVLASELRMNVNVATMASFLTDEQLTAALSKVPIGHLLLLEDVDATRREAGTGPSFSALLNAIDGLAAQDGRILVMTTNHIDRLDPALIRPGRADVKLCIDLANRDQAERMFLRFFPGYARLASGFADSWRGQSMAEIQKHLMAHRDCPSEALSRGMVLAA